MLKPYDLRCESMCKPIGIDLREPRLTWKLSSQERDQRQTAFRVTLSAHPDAADHGDGFYLDSGKRETNENAYILKDMSPESGARYYWRVKVWDGEGRESEWSEPSWWEMGLLHPEDWADARWIEPEQKPMFEHRSPHVIWDIFPEITDEDRYCPCQLLRGAFHLKDKPVASARAYASAHGIYQLELNGQRVGDLELAPEATPYDKYLQYQTYDIADLLHSGENVLGIHLSTGWWSGLIGLFSASCQYGDRMAAIAKLVVRYADGSVEAFATGENFKSAESPLRYGELYVGEKYDPAYEQPGWSTPGFDDSQWRAVPCVDYPKNVLRGQNAEPIRVVRKVPAVRVFTAPNGETLIDFGQVMAGKARIRLQGSAGQKVKFYYTEELGGDGNYARNVSGPYNQDTDTYILRGDGTDVYEPKFVYHGFRYIKVAGDVVPALEDIEGLVMASDVDIAGSFECSDPRVTRLHQNVLWTALGNFVSIPTDNPDRERGGWTGDAQMFVETACYVMGLEAFWRRWLREMEEEQHSDGQISSIVPNWKSYELGMTHHKENTTSSAWGDACIILPWVHYCRYGDSRILEENYPMMLRWIHYVRTTAETKNPENVGDLTPERAERLKYMWNTGFHYGDWLTPSDCTDENGNFQYLPKSLPLSDFTPSCYYMLSTKLLSKIATVLGKTEDAREFAELSQKIREACTAEYFDENGDTYEARQGAQVFALYFDIAPAGRREATLDRLIRMIHDNDGLMDTGFSSTQYLLDVLADNGRVREAYDRLFCDRPPSWLYEVEKGATAIWESWQGIMPDGKVNAVSFIQYANGVVGAWLYRTVAGIREAAPGFRRIEICPEPDERLEWVRASYESVQGAIQSGWRCADGVFTLEVEIPTNTQAEILLPGAVVSEVRESGAPVAGAPGVHGAQQSGEKVAVTVGSGRYVFEYPYRS